VMVAVRPKESKLNPNGNERVRVFIYARLWPSSATHFHRDKESFKGNSRFKE
jgi:hypothetical protein